MRNSKHSLSSCHDGVNSVVEKTALNQMLLNIYVCNLVCARYCSLKFNRSIGKLLLSSPFHRLHDQGTRIKEVPPESHRLLVAEPEFKFKQFGARICAC